MDWFYDICNTKRLQVEWNWIFKFGKSKRFMGLRAPPSTGKGWWPCDCEGHWFSSKGCITGLVCWNLHQVYSLLEVGLMQILATQCFVVSYVGIHVNFFVHDNFSGSLGLHLLVWSELGWSLPFRPTRDLIMQWSLVFSLVCKVALKVHKDGVKPTNSLEWWSAVTFVR